MVHLKLGRYPISAELALGTAGVEFIAETGGRATRERRLQPYRFNLKVAINALSLVRFAYDGGDQRWFAPHALYLDKNGSERVRGAIISQVEPESAITVSAPDAIDDFELSRISDFVLARQPKSPRFKPDPGFASADIEGATRIYTAVDYKP